MYCEIEWKHFENDLYILSSNENVNEKIVDPMFETENTIIDYDESLNEKIDNVSIQENNNR